MKISPDGQVVEFQSRDPYYTREKSGIKLNTVRRFLETVDGDDDYRLLVSSLFHLTKIRIIEPTTNQSFERFLTDVTYFDGRFIFSWSPQEG